MDAHDVCVEVDGCPCEGESPPLSNPKSSDSSDVAAGRLPLEVEAVVRAALDGHCAEEREHCCGQNHGLRLLGTLLRGCDARPLLRWLGFGHASHGTGPA